jgi:DNA-binding NarL/FixJ family response regulator
MSRKGADEISIVESMYRLDGDDGQWLGEIADRVRRHLRADCGVVATRLRTARIDETPDVDPPVAFDMPAGAEPKYSAFRSAIQDPEIVGRAMSEALNTMKGGFVDSHPFRQFFEGELGPLGIRDCYNFSCFDTPAHWIIIAPHTSSDAVVTPRLRKTYARLQAHLSSALRLRRRLGSGLNEEAIIEPSGAVLDANGEARRPDARDRLRRAVLDRERARSSLRSADPDASLDLWSGLIAGRWSLLDRFESGGRRYIVACENQNTPRVPRCLTPREEHVAQLAARGRSNHEIAYELGVDFETVSAHLKRALRKLGCSGRGNLIRLIDAAQFELTWSNHGDVIAVFVERSASKSIPRGLTTAEREVFEGVVAGKTNAEIAEERGTSVRTVANQVASVLRKSGARSRYMLMQRQREGFSEPRGP